MPSCTCKRKYNPKCQIHGVEANDRRIERFLADNFGGPFDIARAMLAGRLRSDEQRIAERLLTPGVVALAVAAQERDNAQLRARATVRAGNEIAVAVEVGASINAHMAWQLR